MIDETIFSQWIINDDDVISMASSQIVGSDSAKERILQLTRWIYRKMTSDPPPDDIEIELNHRGSALNSQVDPTLGVLVQYDTEIKKVYSLVRSPHRFAVFIRVLSIAYRNLVRNDLLTKRSIFYHDPELFQSQGIVDDVVEDVACCLEVPRTSLNIIASQKGLVAGPLQWIMKTSDLNNRGETQVVVDCSNKVETIPSIIDSIIAQKTNAIAILVVEKESIFQRIIQSSIIREAIVITAKGVPDYATRLFVKLLEDSFDLPIVGLFDADPYGAFIFFVYRFGSRSSAYDGMNMAISSMKWLGIRPSELKYLDLPRKCFKELDEHDHKLINKLLNEKYLPECYKIELNIMKDLNLKCEIEALTNDANKLIDLYLPTKFGKQDWI